MTEATYGEVVIAMIAGAPALMTAIILLWTSVRNARVANKNAVIAKADADTIIQKANQIHTLTNSNLTTVKADLESANKRIESLEGLLVEFVKKKPGNGSTDSKN